MVFLWSSGGSQRKAVKNREKKAATCRSTGTDPLSWIGDSQDIFSTFFQDMGK